MQETWLGSMGQGDALGKEMAIHTSTVAWELWDRGVQRATDQWGQESQTHNLADKQN